jgi:hypothetical protein
MLIVNEKLSYAADKSRFFETTLFPSYKNFVRERVENEKRWGFRPVQFAQFL